MNCDSNLAACLAAMAECERNYKEEPRIFTRNIYPQDENGNPIYNPSGKYTIKMYLNGAPRAVTIDDFFPVGPDNSPLVSYEPSGQLWVQLLEKAVAKIRGGYANIGIKPSQDLFALTNWIPERICLKNTKEELVWTKLLGDVLHDQKLMVLTTGYIENEESVGLKSFHSYAVFGLLDHKGTKMFLLKNTSPQLTYKQKYCWGDELFWTEDLKKAACYSQYNEWGSRLFWTDLSTVMIYFDYLDINWNPKKLVNRPEIWGMIKESEITNDKFNILRSPQYSIEMFSGVSDMHPNYVLYAIISKIHTKEDNLINDEVPASILGEDFIGLSLYANDRYAKIPYADMAINELDLSSDTVKAYKFEFPKESFGDRKVFNLAVRTHMRKHNLYYQYFLLF